MEVAQKLWDNTRIGEILYLFPGQLGEFIQESTPATLTRAEQWLQLIFYRWYFLESKLDSNIPPYEFLELCRRRENWPSDGHFLPYPSLKIHRAKAQIDLEVDYINFDEQPFLSDLRRLADGKSEKYQFDQKYTNDLKEMLNLLKTKNSNSLPDSEVIINSYLQYQLTDWWQEYTFINKAYSLSEWLDFWQEMFTQAGRSEKLTTRQLINEFTKTMRRTWPNYGLTYNELEQIEELIESGDPIDEARVMQELNFVTAYCFHLIIPFSLYLRLTAPLFVEKKSFTEDVSGILQEHYKDPLPLYTPCTLLSLTNFGKIAFND